jgi:hypothetical protein
MLWQLYSIVVAGEADPYAEAFGQLVIKYTEITSAQDGMFIEELTNGVNVGTEPGNYRKEYVDPFLALHAEVEQLMFASEEGMENVMNKFPTAEDLEAYTKKYTDAYNAVFENKIPLALTAKAKITRTSIRNNTSLKSVPPYIVPSSIIGRLEVASRQTVSTQDNSLPFTISIVLTGVIKSRSSVPLSFSDVKLLADTDREIRITITHWIIPIERNIAFI